jgi:hypothetical protein
MKTKFDLNEDVVFFDYEEEAFKGGTIIGIEAWVNDDGDDVFHATVPNEPWIYTIDSDGDIYEEQEKHLFKSAADCAKYYRILLS